jgi:hypothetical protein
MGESAKESSRNTQNAKMIGIEGTLARLETMFSKLDGKLDDNVTQINTTLDKKIDDLRSNIDTTLDQKITSLRDDIKKELLTKIQHNATKIDTNTAAISALDTRLQQLEGNFELQLKSNDLLVKGVPLLSNEKCTVIYQKIALAIGISMETLPPVDAFRLGKKRAGAERDPPILLKFLNRFDKNAFYQKYFAFKNLNLTHINFQTEKRIIISENLTKQNQQIFSTAIQMKIAQKLHRVSTSEGMVSVRPKEGERPVQIRRLSDLDRFN